MSIVDSNLSVNRGGDNKKKLVLQRFGELD